MNKKKYRIREGSFLWYAVPIMTIMMLIVITGLGNHYIDGIY